MEPNPQGSPRFVPDIHCVARVVLPVRPGLSRTTEAEPAGGSCRKMNENDLFFQFFVQDHDGILAYLNQGISESAPSKCELGCSLHKRTRCIQDPKQPAFLIRAIFYLHFENKQICSRSE